MPKVLVVHTDFADFRRGDVISAKEDQDKVLETHAHCVLATDHAEPAAPDKKPS